MEKTVAIRLEELTKVFGSVVANNKVSLDIYKGEILSILGENGCGKTTLMNMIAGIYYPDGGKILINNEEVLIKSPRDAYDYNIGMVHQHFKLVDIFTAIDNIILGEEIHYSIKEENKKLKKQYQSCLLLWLKQLALPFKKLFAKTWLKKDRGAKIQEIANKYGFEVDLNKKIYEMSVSEKQTVEIIKVLYRGANILILDEPTAVLTPQEIKKLFNVLRKMKEDGKSIIIITHKLNEVMEISDRVAVLRKGEHIGTVETKDTNEKALTEMMVGEKIDLNINRPEPVNSVDRLVVKDLTVINHDGIKVVNNVSFEAKSGEILGIAGIAGSGQKELLEAIAGLQKINKGDILYNDPNGEKHIDLRSKTPSQIRDLGVRLSFVPEDRLGMGLVGNMDIVDNMMLRSYKKGVPIILDRNRPKKLANSVVNELKVSTPSIKTAVRKLSGGNVQKVLVGREIAAAPTVLMAAYPVRGLDINSSYTIYNLLTDQKQKGVSVIFVGEDLDVLLALCDRIVVLCAGKVTGIVDARTITKDQVGLLMTKTNHEEESEEVK